MGSASPMSQGCGGAWQKGFTLVLGMRLKDYDSPPRLCCFLLSHGNADFQSVQPRSLPTGMAGCKLVRPQPAKSPLLEAVSTGCWGRAQAMPTWALKSPPPDTLTKVLTG